MFFSAFQYLKHLFFSFRLHGIHSPFVFHFNKEVIQAKDRYYIFDEIDSLRALLMLSDKTIEHCDYGAGSKKSKSKRKKVGQIAKTSAKPAKYGELLFRVAKYSKARNILELGTSLGLSTAYLATATAKSTVTTIEGCPNVAKIAKLNFNKLELHNIQVIQGTFGEVLPDLLQNQPPLDLVFFDGNHTEHATLEYFSQCLEKAHEESVFIFDDIHWSAGMERAWKKIAGHPSVSVSIDLFQMGIVFFKKGQEKEHFTIHH